jgi:UDP-glucose 4-epimerase
MPGALLDAGHTVTGLARRVGQLESRVSEWADGSVDFAGIDAAWPAELQLGCVVIWPRECI